MKTDGMAEAWVLKGAVAVAGTLCVLASIGKIATLLWRADTAATGDPIFNAPLWVMSVVVVPLELLACGALWWARKRLLAQGVVLSYVGGCFVLYHMAMLISGERAGCGCFGRWDAWLGLSSRDVETLAAISAWYIFVVGVVIVVRGMTERSRSLMSP